MVGPSPGLPPGAIPLSGRVTARDRQQAGALFAAGWRILLKGAPGFPARLERELGDDCPPLLYALGDVALAGLPALAIIGTRRPSPGGRKAAAGYAAALARHRISVVSGNAPGADSAAHHGALDAGGVTVVFPPVPPDQFVPAFELSPHADRALVLTAFAPGAAVQPWMFLSRNLLVAAYCRAALVAETGVRGGTLNTVAHLRRMGRPVFCVELPPVSPRHRAHELLRAGGCRALPLLPDTGAISGLLQAMRRAPSAAPPHQADLFSGNAEP